MKLKLILKRGFRCFYTTLTVAAVSLLVDDNEKYPEVDWSRSPAHSVHGPTQCTLKSKNTKNLTLLYTIKIDPIDAALAVLELQDPPNYT
jgi:hypothetical protein